MIPIDELYNAERRVGDHVELTENISELSPLANADIIPTQTAQRTWSVWHIAALWVGMAVCIPSYNIASGMIKQGMNWKQALFVVFLGNVIVLVPMILNAIPGTKYGIPFPVLARSSFGTLGANIPAVLRGLVACGWFGIQTWIGGSAFYEMGKIIYPKLAKLGDMPAFMGMHVADTTIGAAQGALVFQPLTIGAFLCFLIFWAWNVFHIMRGMDSIKWLETLAAPFLIVIGIAFMFWANIKAGGWGPMLSQPATADFGTLFWPNLTGMVCFWATLSLNIPDFSRYARSQRDQMMGQAIGLPATMGLYAFVGIAVTSATAIIFGEMIWDPITLLGKMGEKGLAPGWIILFASFTMAVATISTNIAANVVSPANDFSNLAPRYISFRTGGLITAVVGVVMMPWKLVADPTGYIFTWLIGYGTLLGPIAGIMIADYFIVRRQTLNLLDLYRTSGIYSFTGGVNPAGVGALIIGVLPNVFPFAAQVGWIEASKVPPILNTIYQSGWFVGFGLAFVVYIVWMKVAPPKTGTPVAQPS